jgi:hypothetical protein
VVETVEGLRDVGVADAVDDIDVLASVEVVHAQMVLLRCGGLGRGSRVGGAKAGGVVG